MWNGEIQSRPKRNGMIKCRPKLNGMIKSRPKRNGVIKCRPTLNRMIKSRSKLNGMVKSVPKQSQKTKEDFKAETQSSGSELSEESYQNPTNQPKWFCDYGHDLIGQITGQPMISSNHYWIQNILHTIDATSLLIWCCIKPTIQPSLNALSLYQK